MIGMILERTKKVRNPVALPAKSTYFSFGEQDEIKGQETSQVSHLLTILSDFIEREGLKTIV